MTKFMSRLATVVWVSIVALILIINISAKYWKPIPAILIQHYSPSSATSSIIVYDVETGIQYPYDYAFSYTSPDGKLSYEADLLDQVLSIYIRDYPNGQAELLGTYEQFSMESVLAWSYDSSFIFLATKPLGDNLQLYQIDLDTGEARLFGGYDFVGNPYRMSMLNDHLLLLERENYFALIDTTTGEMNAYESSIQRSFSEDRQYLVFGAYGYFARTDDEAATTRTVLQVLNLETMAQVTVDEDFIGERIFQPSGWSPSRHLLPLILEDGRILMYDADNHRLEVLPEHYRDIEVGWSFWSNDGIRILVFNFDTEKYVILNSQTGEEIVLQDHDIPLYDIQWSPDANYLLVARGYSFDDLAYYLHDTKTGEIIRELDQLPIDTSKSHYVGWYWSAR